MALIYKEFSKYMTLRMVGDPITVKQAREIILKTSLHDNFPTVNDFYMKQLEEHLRDIIPPEFNMASSDEIYQNIYGAIRLEYLYNNLLDFGYPTGWLNWDGKIETRHNHLIGKWPTARELFHELTILAMNFPFLNLSGQLIDQEHKNKIELNFKVSDGSVNFFDDSQSVLNTNAADVEPITTKQALEYLSELEYETKKLKLF